MCRFDRSGDSLRSVAQFVDLPRGVVILDRCADSAGRGHALDRKGDTLRIGAVTILEIDGERKGSRSIERSDVRNYLIESRSTIKATEGEREGGTGRR